MTPSPFTHTRFTRWFASHQRMPFIVALVVLAALLGGPELRLTHPARAVGNTFFVRTDGSDTLCNGSANASAASTPNCAFQTIQKAVNTATTGDTINVAAGTYNELVQVNKTSLTINGANANVNACSGARGAESIVGTGDGAFQILADKVTINGFTIQGVVNDPSMAPFTGLGAGIWTNPGFSGTQGGHQILNNIIQNNIVGIYLNNTGVFPTLVEGNNIQNNNAPGPAGDTGIYSDLGLGNATINQNCFTGHGNAINIEGGATTLAITGNYVNGQTASQIVLGGGVNGAQINGNTITNGLRGIRIGDFSGLGANTNLSACGNRIVGNSSGGIVVDSGGLTGTFNATNNWFGCNAGPGGTGCDTVTNASAGTVNFNPWVVLNFNGPSTVFPGGTAGFTANLNTNSAGGAVPCAPGVPNGTPITFAATCGTMNPAATTTNAGAASSVLTAGPTPGPCNVSTTVDNQTVTNAITVLSAPTVTIIDPLGCTGPGDALVVTVQIPNPSGSLQIVSFTAALPAGLIGLPGTGTSTVGAPPTVTTTSASFGPVTLPAGQTLTATYQVQVTDPIAAGTTLCINTTLTIGGGTPILVQACTTVNCPGVGPGILPSAAAALNDQKAGSVLVFPIYTSSLSNPAAENTRINITNTDTGTTVFAHLFFVDGSSCSVSDNFICLTADQTMTINASDIDPGTTGYVIAVATDSAGCPIDFNRLIGDEYVKFQSGHAANLAAEAISAIAGGLPACSASSVTATLAFNDVSYNALPRVLAIDNIASALDGNSTMLIVDRIGGSLNTTLANIGPLFGILFDQLENPFSFQFNGGCQFRSIFNNSSFPRTTPRLNGVIPAGGTGWLKFWATGFTNNLEPGIVGAVINFNPAAATNQSAFNQGHNLHKLTFTRADSLTIPIFAPVCN